jgi:hypothetical protein
MNITLAVTIIFFGAGILYFFLKLYEIFSTQPSQEMIK